MRFSIEGYLHGTTFCVPNKQLDRQKILDREVVVSKNSQDSTQFNSMTNSEESELEENNKRAPKIYFNGETNRGKTQRLLDGTQIK